MMCVCICIYSYIDIWIMHSTRSLHIAVDCGQARVCRGRVLRVQGTVRCTRSCVCLWLTRKILDECIILVHVPVSYQYLYYEVCIHVNTFDLPQHHTSYHFCHSLKDESRRIHSPNHNSCDGARRPNSHWFLWHLSFGWFHGSTGWLANAARSDATCRRSFGRHDGLSVLHRHHGIHVGMSKGRSCTFRLCSFGFCVPSNLEEACVGCNFSSKLGISYDWFLYSNASRMGRDIWHHLVFECHACELNQKGQKRLIWNTTLNTGNCNPSSIDRAPIVSSSLSRSWMKLAWCSCA